jgi:hypothetical protein
MSSGKSFLSAVVADGSVSKLLQFGAIDHLFKTNEVEVWEFVKIFVKKHGKIPSEDTIIANTGETLVLHKEPPSYYLEIMQKRHIEQELKKGMKGAAEHLLATQPDKALQLIAEVVMGLVSMKNNHMVTDFRQAYDMIIGEYKTQLTKDDYDRLEFGWPALDNMSGGLTKGDVCSLVGRPGQGKTWQMLYTAMYGWKKTNLAHKEGLDKVKNMDGSGDHGPPQSRMFVSMEMRNLPIAQRMASILASVPMFDLDIANLSSKYMTKLKTNLTTIKGFAAPFYIIDGNLSSKVEDIWALVRQLEPDALFIDGGYLLKHPTERDRYRRVAENAELIKQELAPLCPTVVSWQFARSASKKKKKGEKITGDDVGYTDAILQVSSLLLGLLEQESVETINKRKVDILKGRKGEVGSFEVNWSFESPNAMDFSQVMEESLEDLQYI